MPMYSFDDSSRRVQRDVIIGGSPLRIFRLSTGGALVADAITDGTALPAGHRRLTGRLLEAGAIHPLADQCCPTPVQASDVTVVIPCFEADPSSAVAAARAAGVKEIIVVDDASPISLSIADVTVVRLERNRGPAGARNAGLAQVSSPFVAFVDADAEPDVDWLTKLLWMFDDERVGLVAPRICSRPGTGVIERYEQWRSPLDLGRRPAIIRSGSRVSYVPGATIIVRTAALRLIDGFDESLRFGEDVDLVWRLDEAGWMCRYEPAATVRHAARPKLAGWLLQRMNYGSSAAALDRRHPGALAPTRTSRWSALIWALAAVGRPFAAAAVGVGTIAALARKLGDLEHPVIEAVRLGGRGNFFSGRLFAAAVTRAWWPIFAFAGLFSTRVRRVLLTAAIAPACYDWLTQRPDLDLFTAVTLRLGDDMSYGAGVWRGMLREHRVGPIIPAFPELTKPSGGLSRAAWRRPLRAIRSSPR